MAPKRKDSIMWTSNAEARFKKFVHQPKALSKPTRPAVNFSQLYQDDDPVLLRSRFATTERKAELSPLGKPMRFRRLPLAPKCPTINRRVQVVEACLFDLFAIRFVEFQTNSESDITACGAWQCPTSPS